MIKKNEIGSYKVWRIRKNKKKFRELRGEGAGRKAEEGKEQVEGRRGGKERGRRGGKGKEKHED